eukprot:CAMPEP_0203892850 /NCGR_PEP_ID=MMETSP0359-20131031/35991_1 /ASSEMBLY_ACC=CAM_ASM_000338 /TAXON_ID=268821 /ORGANISM="Scrippsiella Hangoei, Strain SHTV-5" /LENGTH=60 /DNA_ID=CAMNT_0050814885 /DNA_START=36 /DNA_END=214 /DNA_ORIENTATION=+
MHAKSRTDIEDPKRTPPKSAKVEPSRANDLRESEAPTHAKSNTANEAAKREAPQTENADP